MALPNIPPLDGQPPTPSGVPAGAPVGAKGAFNAMSPTQSVSVDTAGALQLVQMALQTGAAVSKGLLLLGQLLPGFAPVAAQLDTQLRGGMKAALQQGLSAPTEPPAVPQFDQMGQMAQGEMGGMMGGSGM